MREVERLEQRVLRHLVRAGLDHRQAFLRADDDQVELGLLLGLLQRRVDHELPADQTDPHRADRPEERHRREHQRRRDAVDREDVVRHDHVGREHGDDALHLVAIALRPQRPDRPVDHPRGQDRLLALAPFALEETAGDLPGGIHPLLDVDGEREEVRPLASLGAALGGCKDHRVAGAHQHRPVRLLCKLARLERDLAATDGHADGNRRLLLLGLDNAHLYSSTLLCGGRRFGSAAAHSRGSLKPPPSGA